MYFNANSNDGVIAVGGGSGMDVGKGIAFMPEQNRPLWDFEDISDCIREKSHDDDFR